MKSKSVRGRASFKSRRWLWSRSLLSRTFIILDTAATDAATIGALAGAALVLGVVYWPLRDRDDRSARTSGA